MEGIGNESMILYIWIRMMDGGGVLVGDLEQTSQSFSVLVAHCTGQTIGRDRIV